MNDVASMDELGEHYLDTLKGAFERQKRLGEGALAQLGEEDVFWRPDAESNSVAVIVTHLHGNMKSRWTDFLTRDGEKPDRDRDGEFRTPTASLGELRALWDEGWGYLFGSLSRLAPSDLLRTVSIRGEPHSVVQAIERQLAHCAYHVGQIVFIAKHLKSDAWTSLSIPAEGRRQRPPR